MKSVWISIVYCGLFASGCALAQDAPADHSGGVGGLLDFNTHGVRITNVTVSSSFDSESIPSDAELPGGSVGMLSTGATVGWSKTAERSNYLVSYTPSYIREFHLTNYHAFDQSAVGTGTWKLGSGWSVSGSFQGMLSDFNQLLFAPTLYGDLSAAATNIEELAAGLAAGASGAPALGELLSITPVNGSPNSAFLYGGRELSISGGLSAVYAPSTRSSYRLSVQGGRTQYLHSGASSAANLGPQELLPYTTMANAVFGWTYSLSPRTTFSADLGSSRTISNYERANTVQATGSVSRTLSARWFVQGTFGIGYLMPQQSVFEQTQHTEPEAGGSVGYKFGSQSLLGSFMHSVSDSYGLGALSSDSSNAAWSWNRPGSSYSVNAAFGYVRMTGGLFPVVASWTGRAALSKRLSKEVAVSAAYSYVRYPEAIAASAPNLQMNGVMLSLNWTPIAGRQ